MNVLHSTAAVGFVAGAPSEYRDGGGGLPTAQPPHFGPGLRRRCRRRRSVPMPARLRCIFLSILLYLLASTFPVAFAVCVHLPLLAPLDLVFEVYRRALECWSGPGLGGAWSMGLEVWTRQVWGRSYKCGGGQGLRGARQTFRGQATPMMRRPSLRPPSWPPLSRCVVKLVVTSGGQTGGPGSDHQACSHQNSGRTAVKIVVELRGAERARRSEPENAQPCVCVRACVVPCNAVKRSYSFTSIHQGARLCVLANRHCDAN